MDVMQITMQNPDAEMPMIIPVIVLNNTPKEKIEAHVRANTAINLPWLNSVPAHDRVAIICGGGPSLADHEQHIWDLADAPRVDIFGLNGAARWCFEHGLAVDYQIIVDAQEQTADLIDPYAQHRICASQVHPLTAAQATMLFSLANEGIEELFPPERVARGGYTLVGGGVSVGITALCVAYTLGYRKMHLFGYDSSNRNGATHAYMQLLNVLIPNIDVTWAGKTYTASMPMKLQAEAFPAFARALIEAGCEIEVHGDGLLPAMWHNPPMTEREKYQQLWTRNDYRQWSPGEDAVEQFLEVAKPHGHVVDFGCGTGRAGKAIHEAGNPVLLVDFTDNCRDRDCMGFPFLQWDLAEPMPFRAPWGFCADVMEHIPTDDVPTVIRNITEVADRVWFQIATRPDKFGATIGQQLHLTVRNHKWWSVMLERYGDIMWQEERPGVSSFYIFSDRKD